MRLSERSVKETNDVMSSGGVCESKGIESVDKVIERDVANCVSIQSSSKGASCTCSHVDQCELSESGMAGPSETCVVDMQEPAKVLGA